MRKKRRYCWCGVVVPGSSRTPNFYRTFPNPRNTLVKTDERDLDIGPCTYKEFDCSFGSHSPVLQERVLQAPDLLRFDGLQSRKDFTMWVTGCNGQKVTLEVDGFQYPSCWNIMPWAIIGFQDAIRVY